MSITAMYNNIAQQYTAGNRFGSISQSHACGIEQITQARLGSKTPYHVLDFGIGDGAFLKQLQPLMPQAEFTGIDTSSEMLKIAQKNLPFTPIKTSAAKASHFIPHQSQDLVIAHFINAYLPIDTLFNQARLLTQADGYFSLITSTFDAFPNGQRQLNRFGSENKPLNKIFNHYYKKIMQNTTVAANKEALFDAFMRHQFEIISHQRLNIPILLSNIKEMLQFGIDGTWGLNVASIRILPNPLIIKISEQFVRRIISFPYFDTHVIDVILAKKLQPS